MSGVSLEVVVQFQGIPARVVWDRLYASHQEFLDGVGELEFDGKTCLARDVAQRIERGGRPHFGITWDGCTLDYSHVANSNLSFVSVEGCVRGKEDAEKWLEPFLRDDAFRVARFYDAAYEFWQNAEDPLEYEATGRSFAHLPMRSNGLPPPLEQLVIDTSRNPGRRVLRHGFIEAVSALMWLGPSFWLATGAKKDTLRAQSWLRCDELPGGVVRIKAAEAPFTEGTGEPGRVQERLRSLLFPGSSPKAWENTVPTRAIG
jgi:hypothetical protein